MNFVGTSDYQLSQLIDIHLLGRLFVFFDMIHMIHKIYVMGKSDESKIMSIL